MSGAQLRAILILPFNVLITLPTVLLWWEGGRLPPALGPLPLVLAGLGSLTVGVSLMVASIRLFHGVGQGTLAPWDPPKKLVVAGPFCYVRNPMISGVLFNLAGEALLFSSPALAAWWGFFFVGNTAYMAASEEPALRARFGEDYERYCRNVRRWLPRLSPWDPEA